MRERVASARPLGVARLEAHDLVCDKPGRDGSAKANLFRAPGAIVWGVVYRIDPRDWEALDRFEGGYERVSVEVELLEAGRTGVLTYVSELRSADGRVFDWYREHLVRGARSHGLPEDWCRRLEALPTRSGPR